MAVDLCPACQYLDLQLDGADFQVGYKGIDAVSYTHLVQEALHLSDAETMEITHFERGHGLISTNNNNIMVEFKASPLEKELITTDRRELREIVERKRREQSTSAEQQI